MDGGLTRGFRARPRVGEAARLPPGQYWESMLPVLTYGDVPAVPPGPWRVAVTGAVAQPCAWDLAELEALGTEEVVRDLHCVTRWSRRDTRWRGVPVAALLDSCAPRGAHALVRAEGGYEASLALDDLGPGRAWLALGREGGPLEREHGGPVRLLVPGRYLWKSVKWVREIQVHEEPARGTWERYGYHDRGDPFAEERLATAPGPWRAARVSATGPEGAPVRRITLDVAGWTGHRAGQHVEIRLRDATGGEARRIYSIASPPAASRVEIVVARMEGGEVSPHLVDELRPGDAVGVRGPLGDWFVWDGADEGRPLLLVGGGTGAVPLIAIARADRQMGAPLPARLVLCMGPETEGVLARDLAELEAGGAEVRIVRGARPPAGLLADACFPDAQSAFVAGSTGFVEEVARSLRAAGPPGQILRTERFGPGVDVLAG